MSKPWHVNEGLAGLVVQLLNRYRFMTIGTIGDAQHRSEVSDHNPNAAGRVNAADLMLGRFFTEADALELIPFLITDPRTKYLIHDRRIWRDPVGHTAAEAGWHDYTGTDPHTDHIHLSVWDSAHTSTGPWTLEDDMTPDELLGADKVPNPYPSAKATKNPTITVSNALKGAASADAKADEILTLLRQVIALLSK